jgi:hypothetical protein
MGRKMEVDLLRLLEREKGDVGPGGHVQLPKPPSLKLAATLKLRRTSRRGRPILRSGLSRRSFSSVGGQAAPRQAGFGFDNLPSSH